MRGRLLGSLGGGVSPAPQGLLPGASRCAAILGPDASRACQPVFDGAAHLTVVSNKLLNTYQRMPAL